MGAVAALLIVQGNSEESEFTGRSWASGLRYFRIRAYRPDSLMVLTTGLPRRFPPALSRVSTQLIPFSSASKSSATREPSYYFLVLSGVVSE